MCKYKTCKALIGNANKCNAEAGLKSAKPIHAQAENSKASKRKDKACKTRESEAEKFSAKECENQKRNVETGRAPTNKCKAKEYRVQRKVMIAHVPIGTLKKCKLIKCKARHRPTEKRKETKCKDNTCQNVQS